MGTNIDRERVSCFLFEEAQLLDEWRLDEWLALFLPTGTYQVPAMDQPDLPPERALYLIDDDNRRLTSRVNQLLGHFAYAENPRSRTRRMISNVLIGLGPDATIAVRANFHINRFRHEQHEVFAGHYVHFLGDVDGQLKFVSRKAILDNEALRPQGKISFIV